MTYSPPYALAQVSVNGGPPSPGGGPGAGVVIPASATIQFSGVNTTGWETALWELYDYPPAWPVPSGWTRIAATGVVQFSGTSLTPNPPVWTAPTISGWGKWGLRLTVNNATDPQGAVNFPRMVDTSLALTMYSLHGFHDGLAGEQSQFIAASPAPNRQWAEDYKLNVRTMESLAASGGSISPTQGAVALTGGVLNSDVDISGLTSIRFTGCTAGTSLGGMNIAPTPVAGVPFDVEFDGPITIVNLDGSSSSGNQIVTGTGVNVRLPLGQKGRARLVRTVVGGVSTYNLASTGVHQSPHVYSGDFGFVGDGATANDTQMAALIASLGSLASTPGAIVEWSSGTYLFHNPVDFTVTGVVHRGCDYGLGTIWNYDGVGTFWTANGYQRYEHLTIQSTLSNAYSANPGQQNVITNCVSNGGPNLIRVTTAVAHGYTTGDIVGIYGVTGTVEANCDAAAPWTVTVINATTFDLQGSTFTHAFTSTTLTVNAASNAAGGAAHPIVVGTTTPHGLHGGQLVYIASVGGNTAANGLMRVFGQLTSSTAFGIAINVLTNIQAGNGNYTSGGTVLVSGACVSYSHNAQVGWQVVGVGGGANGNCHLRHCFFGGWKYGVSLDSAEQCSVEDCQFGLAASAGYLNDQETNDSTHASAGIRIGEFVSYPLGSGVTNVDLVRRCIFSFHYIATFHHDGNTHTVNDCTYENQVIALIQSANSVTIDGGQNDGSTDSQGLIKIMADATTASPSMLRVLNVNAGGDAAFIWASETLSGLKAQENVWTGAGMLVQGNGFIASPVILCPNTCPNATTFSDIVAVIPNVFSGVSTAFTGGTTINHYLNPSAALDVGFYPYSPNGPKAAYRYNAYSTGLPDYSAKIFAPTANYWNGSMQDRDCIISGESNGYGGTKATGLGRAYILAAGATVHIGQVDLACGNGHGSGSITMLVHASKNNVENLNSWWKIRQHFYKVGATAVLGAIEELEFADGIGGLTQPAMSLAGSYPNEQVQVDLVAHASLNINWAVRFNVDYDGA